VLRVVAFWPHAWHYLYPSQILRFQTHIDPAIVISMFILLFLFFFFYRLLCITVEDTVIKRRWLESFLVAIELRWEVIVRLVDIIGLVDHYCLNFLFINCPMPGISLACSLYLSGLFSPNMSGCNDNHRYT
jgi:hypothetical protein